MLFNHFSIPDTRPCRVRSITIRYASAHSTGTTFSFTIESSVSKDDATCRSPPLMLTPYPQRFTLRNPRSTDFAYINETSPISDITVYNSNTATTENVYSFFLATVTMEFMPMQPNYKDLGLLPLCDDDEPGPSTPSDLSII